MARGSSPTNRHQSPGFEHVTHLLLNNMGLSLRVPPCLVVFGGKPNGTPSMFSSFLGGGIPY